MPIKTPEQRLKDKAIKLVNEFEYGVLVKERRDNPYVNPDKLYQERLDALMKFIFKQMKG